MATLNDKSHAYDLKALLGGIVGNDAVPNLIVTGITLDSRKVQAGDVFFALKGSSVNAVNFVRDAIKQGACAVVAESGMDELTLKEAQHHNVPIIDLPNLPQVLGAIAARFYSKPSERLKLIGVTGTDGKTSVTHFIAQALKNLSKKCGVVGTLGNGLYEELITATHTTPDVLSLNKVLSELNGQTNYVAMEVSSHGIDQKRIDGLQFETAVLTNLSRDHLDYHGNLGAYKAAKQKLFAMPGLKNAVVNIDDEFGRSLLELIDPGVKVWAYGLDRGAALQADQWVLGHDLQLRSDGFSFEIETLKHKGVINTALLGQFNASNILAAFAALLSAGVAFDELVGAFQGMKGVAGRVELFQSESRPNVVVDYAHTPMALKSVLSVLKNHYQGSLVCVFGCGGNRDKGKRSLMGRVAAELSDYVVLTDDNPREESPTKIIADIVSGLDGFKNFVVEHDREKAITQAIEKARVEDVVLIAGKGHEDYQIVGQQRYDFSDRLVVQKLLEDKAL